MQRREIIMNYVKTWFVLDFFASFPYSWVINYDDNPDSSSSAYRTPQLLRLLKFMRFIRILRLLRVLKLQRIFIKFEENVASETWNVIIKFVKLIILITFIAHWIACFFYAIAESEIGEDDNCWIVVAGIRDSPIRTKYIFSLYWAFTTMTTVGYGDIHPNTPRERALTLITMLISCVVYAYTIGSIGSLVNRHNMHAAQYKEKMTYVNQFLIRKEIPKELRLKIRRYLEYILNSKKTVKVDQEEVFAVLNKNLEIKMRALLNGRILKNIKVFKNFDIDFLSDITKQFKKQTFALDDNIIVVIFTYFKRTIGRRRWRHNVLYCNWIGDYFA